MNSRVHPQSILNNSVSIRQEIQRFESVHPSIYAIYDLIELLPEGTLSQQLRDHVVCIEDSFVNSQEWTLSRNVPDLRLGIVGSLSSGKSALVHRYLTGSYMQEESPEGGRFKKEVLVENQSYLLLIRDEGGPPEVQFTAWVDAVIFVFSLESESSFNVIYNYFTKMSYFRNASEIPLVLVGTQDAISENNPRVIDDSRARKLASDLKRCTYYETCATYGLNVEKVFQDACLKIVQQRLSASVCLTPTNSRPSTPNHFNTTGGVGLRHHQSVGNGMMQVHSPNQNQTTQKEAFSLHPIPSTLHKDGFKNPEEKWKSSTSTLGSHGSRQTLALQENNNHKYSSSKALDNMNCEERKDDITTPNLTPTTSRKSRRRSNLFTQKKDDKLKNNGDFGSGRAIPLKQGYLYKRSSKPLNKEWKKKYVTLCDDGRLTYHPSLHDYMDNVHGKEIPLQCVTVKIPGQKPRGSKSIITVAGSRVNETLAERLSGFTLGGKDKATEKVLVNAFEVIKDPSFKCPEEVEEFKAATPSAKKRHRRVKSSGIKSSEYEDPVRYEFYIVSLDNKQWHFGAIGAEERSDWVTAIEEQILNSLQLNDSNRTKNDPYVTAAIQNIRSGVLGNGFCVDCGAGSPEWASLNLGVLMCIECSGIHRNLGSHISRVRSLGLDDWSAGKLSVMLSIGNHLANSVWEGQTLGKQKPGANASREEKERWIRAKYEAKEFLPQVSSTLPLGQQVIEAVCGSDMKGLIHALALAGPDEVNMTVGSNDLRTPLHLACALGNLAVAQLLIWNGADVRAVDQDGRTCLAYARAAASVSSGEVEGEVACKNLVELLMGYNCPESSNVGTSGTLARRRSNESLRFGDKGVL